MLTFREFKDLNIRDDQKNNDINHFFSKYFVNFFAYFFYLLRLSPNQVTYIFILTGIIGGILGSLGFFIAAYIFWRIHIIIDMADGSIARVTKVFSEFGDTLDKIGHHIIYPIYWVGISYSSGLLILYPLLTVCFIVIASSQWTLKHIFKDKSQRPSTSNFFKRLVANILGIEGFLVLMVLYAYTDFFSGLHLLFFLIFSNILLFFYKLYSLIVNG